MRGVSVAAESAVADWVAGLADLWGLGVPGERPESGLVGFADASGAGALAAAAAAGEIAGAVATVASAGPAAGPIPAAREVRGKARFDGGTVVEGRHVVFDSGQAVARSDLGAHAVLVDGSLFVGIDPNTSWGRVDGFWAYEAIAAYLRDCGLRLEMRMRGIGCLRLDDTPGTAQHQLEGRAKPDWRQSRRILKTVRRLERRDAVLNIAVAAEGLEDGIRVPLERVWPESIRAWRLGVEAGVVEPVCHGVLHLDTDAFEAGEVEFREFARLDAEEAGRRIDQALEWQTANLGRPPTFVAPAWSYGAGDVAGAERGLVRWHRPAPGPLLSDGRLRETVFGALPGLVGTDFTPLGRLADVGIPPLIAMHGALLDARRTSPRSLESAILLAKLLFRRDLPRLLAIPDIRWVAASDLVGRLRGGRGE